MTASDKLNEAAEAISKVGDAIYLAQAVLIRVADFLKLLGTDFSGYEQGKQRSR